MKLEHERNAAQKSVAGLRDKLGHIVTLQARYLKGGARVMWEQMERKKKPLLDEMLRLQKRYLL